MNKQAMIFKIRSKKLGILIYDARLASRRTIEECAAAMYVTPEEYQAFESGQASPSLPALEALAYFLDIPLEHFWGHQALSNKPVPLTDENSRRLRALRDRYIGAHLRQKRNEKNLSLGDVSEQTGLAEEQIKRYELGQESVPLPQLELLADAVGLRMEELFDQHGPIGRWRAQEEAARELADLPPHLQEFVLKPVNRPYIELAIRLNELNVEKLRSIAEGLLEITY
jgi:transcriptional regulator with XRE-family HTH domain